MNQNHQKNLSPVHALKSIYFLIAIIGFAIPTWFDWQSIYNLSGYYLNSYIVHFTDNLRIAISLMLSSYLFSLIDLEIAKKLETFTTFLTICVLTNSFQIFIDYSFNNTSIYSVCFYGRFTYLFILLVWLGVVLRNYYKKQKGIFI